MALAIKSKSKLSESEKNMAVNLAKTKKGKTMVKVERIQNVSLWNFFAGQKMRLAALQLCKG